MIYQITIPAFIKSLTQLNLLFDKAHTFATAKKIDVSVLLESRLAPDQFNLIRQVQIACDTAKLGASRLTGKEAPTHDDKDKTLEELRTRIKETISYLEKFSEADFKDAKDVRISQPRWEGKWLTGEEYVLHHVLPNLYFHITTAYSILRHNGVEVGKKDYLGPMPYKT